MFPFWCEYEIQPSLSWWRNGTSHKATTTTEIRWSQWLSTCNANVQCKCFKSLTWSIYLIGQWDMAIQAKEWWLLWNSRLQYVVYGNFTFLWNINKSNTRNFIIVARLQTVKVIDLSQHLSIVTQFAGENNIMRNFLFKCRLGIPIGPESKKSCIAL